MLLIAIAPRTSRDRLRTDLYNIPYFEALFPQIDALHQRFTSNNETPHPNLLSNSPPQPSSRQVECLQTNKAKPCLGQSLTYLLTAGRLNYSGGLMVIFLLKSWKETAMVSQVPGLFLFSAVTMALTRVCPLFSTQRRLVQFCHHISRYWLSTSG
jgi:hypothetical protein